MSKRLFCLFLIVQIFSALIYSPPFAQGESKSMKGEIAAKLDGYLKRAAEFGFSGAALVAVDGNIILEKGYGLADRKRGVPINANTVFNIGSITKQFTAAAIMKLEMQGKLKTEEPLSKYLDSVPADKSDVTIHQLLTHTAGFPEYSGPDYVVSERDETISRILKTPLTNKPGVAMNYSNAGYSVLAAVVEKVSGQSYESFLREHLFKPAGMIRTGYVIPKFDKAALPRGYNGQMDLGTEFDNLWSPTGPYWNLFGNGGILSTVGDMFKWYKALQGNEIFSEAARKKMFTPISGTYAYGWVVNKTPNGTSIGHSGAGDNGFNAKMNWYPERNIVVITMSNAGEYYGGMTFASVVSGKLNALMFGADYAQSLAVRHVRVDASELAKYEGTFRLLSGGMLVVAAKDGSLTIEPSGQDGVDALTVSSDPSAGNKMSTITRTITSGIVKRDFGALRESMSTEDAFNRYRLVFEQRLKNWEMSDGVYKDFQVLGTVPAWWSEDPQPTSFVKLDFEKGPHYFRLHWKDGKISGLGGESIKSPVTIPLIADSNDSFSGWHMALSTDIKVRFTVKGDRVTGLTVKADGKTVNGVKAE